MTGRLRAHEASIGDKCRRGRAPRAALAATWPYRVARGERGRRNGGLVSSQNAALVGEIWPW